MDKISIIIPAYYSSQELVDITARCIYGLRDFKGQIIVIDDGSPIRALHEIGESVRLPENQGYAAAVNVGLDGASGDFLIICNNDIEFIQPDWLDHLLKPLKEGYSISSIRTSDSDGFLTEDKYEQNAKFGSIWAITKAAYELLGPLDESFGRGYYEDQDYWRRARDMGLRIVKNHAGLVEHKGKATFNSLEDKEYDLLHAMFKYKQKWGDKVTLKEVGPNNIISVDDYDKDVAGYAYAKSAPIVTLEDVKRRWPQYL